MRSGSFRARLVTAGLDDDDRLETRGLTAGRHELPRVGDRSDIEQDALRLRVGGEIIEHVTEIDVGHAAERGNVGEADAAARRPVEHGRDNGARLRDEGDIALAGLNMAERGVEPVPRRHDAETIGPRDAQQMWPRRFEHLRLKRAAFLTEFAETRRDDDGGPGAAPSQFVDDAGDRLGRRRDDGEIRCFRQARNVPVNVEPGDLPALRIDRPDRPRQPGTQKIVQEDVADGPRLGGGADQGDGTGSVHAVEITDRHRVPRSGLERA